MPATPPHNAQSQPNGSDPTARTRPKPAVAVTVAPPIAEVQPPPQLQPGCNHKMQLLNQHKHPKNTKRLHQTNTPSKTPKTPKTGPKQKPLEGATEQHPQTNTQHRPKWNNPNVSIGSTQLRLPYQKHFTDPIETHPRPDRYMSVGVYPKIYAGQASPTPVGFGHC